jgi:hydrogenase-4 component E
VTGAGPPPAVAGVAEGLALAVLLSEFAMLRAPLLRNQVRLYAAQSVLVSGFALLAGSLESAPELFALAGASFALKAVVVPLIVTRMLRWADVRLVASHRAGVASMTLLAAAVGLLGVLVATSLPVRSAPLPPAVFDLATATVLVAFLLVILRSDVVSQAVGFFALENGVTLASLVIAAMVPLVVEVAFLFDLLVAVVVFAVLMRAHHERRETLSTHLLDRLKG